jgi:glutamine synthetase
MNNPTTEIHMASWCAEHQITDVECLVPDMSGIARGKILTVEKFLEGVTSDTHRMPETIFAQSVSGDFPDTHGLVSLTDRDLIMRPDANTIRLLPWREQPTAQVICDCLYTHNEPVEISPRQILRNILTLYENKGWKPVVAPEVEMYLVRMNMDPHETLEPPMGRSGRVETGRQAFGVDATNEFYDLFKDVYDYCKASRIDIDTLNHECGAAQMEINLLHGEPLELADQVFLFKRTMRQTAIEHDIHATFMARPMHHEAGSALHIHQSLYDLGTGENLFSEGQEADTPLFLSYIAGLQTYAPLMMSLFAPTVNSYRRFCYKDAPMNTHWGRDNRSCGLRVPHASPNSRRIENRLPGADVNPYLAMAATLACGYLGMTEGLTATVSEQDNALVLPRNLPVYLPDALNNLSGNAAVRDILGDRFVDLFCTIKRDELAAFDQVITSWEREHLLLTV